MRARGRAVRPATRPAAEPGPRPNVVIGGGVVGLATARALLRADRGRPVVVLEKEAAVARHQSGHNSGVIHSGLYYPPGSLKARLAVQGNALLRRFCVARGIPFDVPGKLVVATRPGELTALDRLYERGRCNGVPVRRLGPREIAEREPAVRALGALLVESTGRVDFRQVAARLADDLLAEGAELRLGTAVAALEPGGDRVVVHTAHGSLDAHRVAVCAGLHADRLARASGVEPGVRILPFRGAYRELVGQRAELVRGLVYPVPDPQLPFLGVHLTRGLDGVVHVGPNAVPALSREGYEWGAVCARDVAELLRYPGSWRLGRRYARQGAREIVRCLAGSSLARAVRRMLPDVRAADLRPAGSGVRAQAVTRGGQLVDDFLLRRVGRVLHVLNAPSPAATACLVIGERIARELVAARVSR
ncbi:MAG TPA: L-2-hydroxyglutarate oxidase [Pilimelia sp.]|nr:L-2-hydroxyglutarate oxidase [Pilimelia sp.]